MIAAVIMVVVVVVAESAAAVVIVGVTAVKELKTASLTEATKSVTTSAMISVRHFKSTQMETPITAFV